MDKDLDSVKLSNGGDYQPDDTPSVRQWTVFVMLAVFMLTIIYFLNAFLALIIQSEVLRDVVIRGNAFWLGLINSTLGIIILALVVIILMVFSRGTRARFWVLVLALLTVICGLLSIFASVPVWS